MRDIERDIFMHLSTRVLCTLKSIPMFIRMHVKSWILYYSEPPTELQLNRKTSINIPPQSFQRMHVYVEEAVNYKFNCTVSAASEIAVYGRKGLRPSHTKVGWTILLFYFHISNEYRTYQCHRDVRFLGYLMQWRWNMFPGRCIRLQHYAAWWYSNNIFLNFDDVELVQQIWSNFTVFKRYLSVNSTAAVFDMELARL